MRFASLGALEVVLNSPFSVFPTSIRCFSHPSRSPQEPLRLSHRAKKSLARSRKYLRWRNSNNLLFTAIAATSLSASCMSGTDSMVVDVPPEGWNEPAELRYSNTDTLSARKLTLALRYSQAAGPTHGLYVVETTAPSGAIERDTLSIATSPDTQRNRMQQEEAEIDTRRLAESGDYRFTVRPPRGTVGVWSVGIELK